MPGPTQRLDAANPADLATAAQLLRAGRLVAVPTETVYGLAANGLDPDAVAGIYAAKERPAENPLILHLGDPEQLWEIAEVSRLAARLTTAFWPGPLTLVLPKRDTVPAIVTAGKPTVAVRVPDHPALRSILQQAGIPVAAPSANRSGSLSPTCAAHVLASLEGRIDAVVDAGPTRIGIESTIVRVVGETATLLRFGPVTPEQLGEVTGPGRLHLPTGHLVSTNPEAPGLFARHYSPAKPIRPIAPQEVPRLSPTTGLLVPSGSFRTDGPVRSLSPSGDPVEAAQNLYAVLHAFDADDTVRQIAVLPVPASPGWEAIADRLRRAMATDG